MKKTLTLPTTTWADHLAEQKKKKQEFRDFMLRRAQMREDTEMAAHIASRRARLLAAANGGEV